MESPSLILTSYQDALTRAMDVVANNVANVNTSGFKREAVQFQTYISRPVAGEKLDFVIDRATYRDVSMGPLTTTGNPLDLAIHGQGYFPIQTKDGTRYTRAGSFQVNAEGEICMPTGEKLLGDGDQAIVVGSEVSNITVGSDGVVSGESAGAMTQLGKLRIVKFDNEQQLQSVGGNLYSTTQTAQVAENSRVVQGMVERSNVESVGEMTRMIEVMRSYQQAAKMLDAETQRMTDAISKLARATA